MAPFSFTEWWRFVLCLTISGHKCRAYVKIYSLSPAMVTLLDCSSTIYIEYDLISLVVFARFFWNNLNLCVILFCNVVI